MAGHDEPKICLDTIISALKDTGLNMHNNYKETSLGGLAVSIIEVFYAIAPADLNT